jgi:hypothetical protein
MVMIVIASCHALQIIIAAEGACKYLLLTNDTRLSLTVLMCENIKTVSSSKLLISPPKNVMKALNKGG